MAQKSMVSSKKMDVEPFRSRLSSMIVHFQAEFREAKIIPVDIFHGPNRFFESVSDAESHDIKIFI